MQEREAVLVCGWYGSGKTSVIQSLATEEDTVIDVAEFAPMAKMETRLRRLGGAKPGGRGFAAPGSGAWDAVESAARDGGGTAWIHLPGSADPWTFAAAAPKTRRVRAVVCVLDGRMTMGMLRLFAAQADGDRSAQGFVVRYRLWQILRQMVVADRVVISRADGIGEGEVAALREMIGRANERAAIFTAGEGAPCAGLLDGAAGYDPAEWADRRAKADEFRANYMDGEAVPELGGVFYRSDRPFHPARFFDAHTRVPGLVCQFLGLVWLAHEPESAFCWRMSGGSGMFSKTGGWTDAEPGQSVAILGGGEHRDALMRMLDGCLLTDEELAQGAVAWRRMENPFDRILPAH